MSRKKRGHACEKKEDHLLDVLAWLADCEYLSDLRLARTRTMLLEALKEVHPERYPQSEWREAMRYVLTQLTGR